MEMPPAQPANSAEAALARYGDILYRLCFVMLRCDADAEDAVQETLLQYLRRAPRFETAEHEKAWLLATAKNKCRDALRYRRRHPTLPQDAACPALETESDGAVLQALMSLPEKYRLVLTLYYVEELRVADIARLIQRTPSAVKMRLQKGRQLLKAAYQKEDL